MRNLHEFRRVALQVSSSENLNKRLEEENLFAKTSTIYFVSSFNLLDCIRKIEEKKEERTVHAVVDSHFANISFVFDVSKL